ncbi:MAG: UDP-glucose--hexose-1-phosphate uridylyltransferase [Roseiflexaceae bacterium]|nr:UDP-glucose--hexose-1-phosphate uridylyltransferase [Roseiflexaceae bacterium]
MTTFKLSDHPHRRYNPLSGEWVLVSPHRTKRPWQGQVETTAPDDRPQYDPQCYLCPGNLRANNAHNPQYAQTFVFENDFAALLADTPEGGYNSGLLRAESERGVARVVCFSPRHDLTLAQIDLDTLAAVVDVWAAQFSELGARPEIGYVQIFENRGAMMGASNPHPHGQIWAQSHVPMTVQREHEAQAAYFAQHGRSLLADYLTQELELAERIVCENEHFVALVPFWAVWPFETMVISRRQVAAIPELSALERRGLAAIFKQLTTRYDNLFQTSFPYSMGFHQRPTDGGAHPHWHLHAHFLPPLLRSATVRKFMVGYELLGEPQRDITPEQAAARLQALSDVHYRAQA